MALATILLIVGFAAQDSNSSVNEATVTVRLEATEAGIVDRCEVTETSAPAAFADQICPIFIGRRFQVQLDSDGRPQRATRVETLRFRLEQ